MKASDAPPVIAGLTGGIACGKTVVSHFFKELGAYVIDADSLGHDAIRKNGPAFENVLNTFGPCILSADGEIDRDRLADVVFNNSEKRRVLERLTHPAIISMLGERISAALNSGAKLVIVESAILFEKGFAQGFDTIIVVHSEAAIQKRRLVQRTGLTDEEAEMRIKSQMPLEEKMRLATHVIFNSGSLEETRLQVEKLFEHLTKTSHENPPKTL